MGYVPDDDDSSLGPQDASPRAPRNTRRRGRRVSYVLRPPSYELLGAHVCFRELRVLCSACFRELRVSFANCLQTLCCPHLQDSQLCTYLIAGIFVGSFEDFSPIKVHRLDFCSFTNSCSRSLSRSLSLSSAFLP